MINKLKSIAACGLFIASLMAPMLATHAQEAAVVQDADVAEVAKSIAAKYPNTKVSQVKSTPLPGIYEVIMGKQVAYTDKAVKFFLFGRMFDMVTQQEVTTPVVEETEKVAFPEKYLGQAMKIVKGDGSRVFAVFSDPNCGYCKQVEKEFTKLDNVTIYTFLYPVLGPQSKVKGVSIWCSPDRIKVWHDAMLKGTPVPLKTCKNPIEENIALGQSMGINGTPTLITLDGRMIPGAAPAEKLSQWLDQAQKVQTK